MKPARNTSLFPWSAELRFGARPSSLVGRALRARRIRSLAYALLSISSLILLSGCATSRPGQSAPTTEHAANNVYRKSSRLPRGVNRVAVLPLTIDESVEPLDEGAFALEPILRAELGKTERFEIIPISPKQVCDWTGRDDWRADESLPTNFLATLKQQTGCDAVMFCELTRFHAYQPISIGWKFRLVATGTDRRAPAAETLWCADEIIDAGNSASASAAKSYQTQYIGHEQYMLGKPLILSSPRRFGQFTLCSVFETLPAPASR
jgi:hypothetical protein